jgi:hypothetical protein
MEESNTVTPEQTTTGPTGPTYLFSVNTLLTEKEQLLQQEERDRALANTISTPNVSELGVTLKQWAFAGFPYMYPILSFSFGMPTSCSDGISRTLVEYIEYLTGKSLIQHIQDLQSKLDGMSVHCEHTSEKSLTLRVARV